MYRDSINERWRVGAHSPAEKYDDAVHGWRPAPFSEFSPEENGFCPSRGREYYMHLGPLAATVHRDLGTGYFMNGSDSDGDGAVDECDDLDGISQDWDLGHARVAAGLVEKRPHTAVEHADVTFEPTDLEALLIAAYQVLTVEGVNEGCRGVLMELTPFGYNPPAHCTFLDARDFHLTIAQLLGEQRRPMGVTRSWNSEAEFATAVGFNVSQMDSIEWSEANQHVQGIPDVDSHRYYAVTTDVTYLSRHQMRLMAMNRPHSTQQHYRYVLVTDATSKIIAGYWSRLERKIPPTLLLATSTPDQLIHPRNRPILGQTYGGR